MKIINIDEEKFNFSTILVDLEKNGQRVIICRNGKPVAELVPHSPKKRGRIEIDPLLSQVKINSDLTDPITEDQWDL